MFVIPVSWAIRPIAQSITAPAILALTAELAPAARMVSTALVLQNGKVRLYRVKK